MPLKSLRVHWGLDQGNSGTFSWFYIVGGKKFWAVPAGAASAPRSASDELMALAHEFLGPALEREVSDKKDSLAQAGRDEAARKADEIGAKEEMDATKTRVAHMQSDVGTVEQRLRDAVAAHEVAKGAEVAAAQKAKTAHARMKEAMAACLTATSAAIDGGETANETAANARGQLSKMMDASDAATVEAQNAKKAAEARGEEVKARGEEVKAQEAAASEAQAHLNELKAAEDTMKEATENATQARPRELPSAARRGESPKQLLTTAARAYRSRDSASKSSPRSSRRSSGSTSSCRRVELPPPLTVRMAPVAVTRGYARLLASCCPRPRYSHYRMNHLIMMNEHVTKWRCEIA